MFGTTIEESWLLAAKTCLYELKISEYIETEHAFQSKTVFHLSDTLISTQVASAALRETNYRAPSIMRNLLLDTLVVLKLRIYITV